MIDYQKHGNEILSWKEGTSFPFLNVEITSNELTKIYSINLVSSEISNCFGFFSAFLHGCKDKSFKNLNESDINFMNSFFQLSVFDSITKSLPYLNIISHLFITHDHADFILSIKSNILLSNVFTKIILPQSSEFKKNLSLEIGNKVAELLPLAKIEEIPQYLNLLSQLDVIVAFSGTNNLLDETWKAILAVFDSTDGDKHNNSFIFCKTCFFEIFDQSPDLSDEDSPILTERISNGNVLPILILFKVLGENSLNLLLNRLTELSKTMKHYDFITLISKNISDIPPDLEDNIYSYLVPKLEVGIPLLLVPFAPFIEDEIGADLISKIIEANLNSRPELGLLFIQSMARHGNVESDDITKVCQLISSKDKTISDLAFDTLNLLIKKGKFMDKDNFLDYTLEYKNVPEIHTKQYFDLIRKVLFKEEVSVDQVEIAFDFAYLLIRQEGISQIVLKRTLRVLILIGERLDELITCSYFELIPLAVSLIDSGNIRFFGTAARAITVFGMFSHPEDRSIFISLLPRMFDLIKQKPLDNKEIRSIGQVSASICELIGALKLQEFYPKALELIETTTLFDFKGAMLEGLAHAHDIKLSSTLLLIIQNLCNNSNQKQIDADIVDYAETLTTLLGNKEHPCNLDEADFSVIEQIYLFLIQKFNSNDDIATSRSFRLSKAICLSEHMSNNTINQAVSFIISHVENEYALATIPSLIKKKLIPASLSLKLFNNYISWESVKALKSLIMLIKQYPRSELPVKPQDVLKDLLDQWHSLEESECSPFRARIALSILQLTEFCAHETDPSNIEEMVDIPEAEIGMDDLIGIMAEYPFRMEDHVGKEITITMLELAKIVEELKPAVTKCFVDILVKRNFMQKKFGIDKELREKLLQFVRDEFLKDPLIKEKIAKTMPRRFKKEKFNKLFQ